MAVAACRSEGLREGISMRTKRISYLNPRKRYLQVALNSTLEDARKIIAGLPISERILVEAGTPFIKLYGASGVRQLFDWYKARLWSKGTETADGAKLFPYVVADLKTMDRAETEVAEAEGAGASAAIALGAAPVETLNAFIDACERNGIDSMIDMMNVEFPLSVLRALKKPPRVVILHRGVDEEHYNRQKQLPLHEIRRIKGSYDVMISVAGGDTAREVQSVVFNDADIVVIWKSVFQSGDETVALVEGFLKEVK